MMAQPVDLSTTFVHLSNGGEAELVELTPAFWRGDSGGRRYDRVVGIFVFRSSKDLHSTMQEVHRESDELLYVISGAIDAVLEDAGAERTVALAAGDAIIVPRGMWHRLVMRRPGKLLVINRRTGTQGRTARNRSVPSTRAGRSDAKRGRRVSVRAHKRQR